MNCAQICTKKWRQTEKEDLVSYKQNSTNILHSFASTLKVQNIRRLLLFFLNVYKYWESKMSDVMRFWSHVKSIENISFISFSGYGNRLDIGRNKCFTFKTKKSSIHINWPALEMSSTKQRKSAHCPVTVKIKNNQRSASYIRQQQKTKFHWMKRDTDTRFNWTTEPLNHKGERDGNKGWRKKPKTKQHTSADIREAAVRFKYDRLQIFI